MDTVRKHLVHVSKYKLCSPACFCLCSPASFSVFRGCPVSGFPFFFIFPFPSLPFFFPNQTPPPPMGRSLYTSLLRQDVVNSHHSSSAFPCISSGGIQRVCVVAPSLSNMVPHDVRSAGRLARGTKIKTFAFSRPAQSNLRANECRV